MIALILHEIKDCDDWFFDYAHNQQPKQLKSIINKLPLNFFEKGMKHLFCHDASKESWPLKMKFYTNLYSAESVPFLTNLLPDAADEADDNRIYDLLALGANLEACPPLPQLKERLEYEKLKDDRTKIMCLREKIYPKSFSLADVDLIIKNNLPCEDILPLLEHEKLFKITDHLLSNNRKGKLIRTEIFEKICKVCPIEKLWENREKLFSDQKEIIDRIKFASLETVSDDELDDLIKQQINPNFILDKLTLTKPQLNKMLSAKIKDKYIATDNFKYKREMRELIKSQYN